MQNNTRTPRENKTNQAPAGGRDKIPLMNERIKSDKIQVISKDGESLGVLSKPQALALAQQDTMDLVVLTLEGPSGFPLAKIMDWGKEQYEKKKKQGEAKKNQKVIQIKEIKLQPKIAEHDFQTKMKKSADFLNDGKRVKITIEFKGREIALKQERGTQLLNRIDEFFDQIGMSKKLVQEKDLSTPRAWSRIYYIK